MLGLIAIGVLALVTVASSVFTARERMAMLVRVAEAAGASDLDRSHLTSELYCRWRARSVILGFGRESRYGPLLLCLDVQVMPGPPLSLGDDADLQRMMLTTLRVRADHIELVDDQLRVRIADRDPADREEAFRRAFELAAAVIDTCGLRRIDEA